MSNSRTNDLGRGLSHASITLISSEELAAHLGCSAWALSEWQRRGLMPRPSIRLAPNLHRWRLSDIEAWLAKLARSPYIPPAARGALLRQHGRAAPPRRIIRERL